MGYREATAAEKERFLKIAKEAGELYGEPEIDEKHQRVIRRTTLAGNTNIVGLSEKALHLTLKYFFQPRDDFHEVYINGFYADIMYEGRITEVQTGNFCSFKKKIDCLSRDFPLMIVHPIRQDNRIITVNGETGEQISSRRSPVHENIYSSFRNLVYIRELLCRENISLSFPVVTTEEKRIVTTGARKPIKAELYPTELLGFYEYDTAMALATLLPEAEKGFFLTKDLAKSLSIPPRTANAMANVLLHLGILRKDGKEGRAIRYIYGENY